MEYLGIEILCGWLKMFLSNICNRREQQCCLWTKNVIGKMLQCWLIEVKFDVTREKEIECGIMKIWYGIMKIGVEKGLYASSWCKYKC